jgi:nucleoside-diphosphate-sugar epimerase
MPFEVVGTGMLARAFVSDAEIGRDAIICAAGVADSQSSDASAFHRERELLRKLIHRSRANDLTLVYFSGAPVYGRVAGIRLETTQVVPETPYGRHKLACERLLAESGVRYLVLRLPNIVGPTGNPNQLIPSLVAQVAEGSVVVMAGATRDLLDVDDLVAVVGALLGRGVADAVLNLASGVSTPVLRLTEDIGAILGVSPSIRSAAGGDRQEFSTALVRGLLPDYPRFEQDYPARVLIRRVPSILRSLQERAVL